MPLSIKTLAAKRNEVDVPFAGDKVHVVYKPAVSTPAWEAEVKAKPSSGYVQIHDIVESWDLMDNDGKTPFPLELKEGKDGKQTGRLLELPSEFIMAVLTEIARDMVPNRPRSDNSEPRSLAG